MAHVPGHFEVAMSAQGFLDPAALRQLCEDRARASAASNTLNAGLRRWQAERREAAAEAARLALVRIPRDPAEEQAERAAAARAATAARKAAALQRTPPWVDMAAIRQLHLQAREVSRETGVPHHVDHVLPLQGRLVSGLHVHTNMRVIPARDNIAKGNRFTP